MKCLSICQPFADLIVSGKKTIELRKWNTKFRGEFLIHAPIKIRQKDAIRLKLDKKFVIGAIVGKSELYDVKKYVSENEIMTDNNFHLAEGNFQSKMFGFKLRNSRPFRIPIPYKGQLGLFDVRITKTRPKKNQLLSEIIDEEYRYQWIGHH